MVRDQNWGTESNQVIVVNLKIGGIMCIYIYMVGGLVAIFEIFPLILGF